MLNGKAKRMRSLTSKSAKPYLLLAPFLVIYLIFIVMPALGIILKSFTANNNISMELLNPEMLKETQLTLDSYVKIFNVPFNLKVLTSTVFISIVSVLITVVIGTPIAYVITRAGFKLRGLAKWFLTLPIYLPIIVVAYALVLFLGPHGVLNSVIEGLTGNRMVLVFTLSAVVIGTIGIILPVYIRTMASAFEAISDEIGEASLSLGATELTTLVKVLLPICKPTMLAAVVLIFAQAIGMIEIALIVGGGGLKILYMPIEIYQKTISFNSDIPFASAMSVLLLLISLIGQVVSIIVLRRKRA